MTRRESIRPCCGTLTDRGAPSPHARDCRTVGTPAPSGGPYCIARGCPLPSLHRAESVGCILAGVPVRVEITPRGRHMIDRQNREGPMT